MLSSFREPKSANNYGITKMTSFILAASRKWSRCSVTVLRDCNYPMVHPIWDCSQNLAFAPELLAKVRWVLACYCSQNFCKCSHARIFVKMPRSISIICILKIKTDCFPYGKLENRRRRAPWMHVSGKMFPRFVDVYWNWPAWVQSQVAG